MIRFVTGVLVFVFSASCLESTWAASTVSIPDNSQAQELAMLCGSTAQPGLKLSDADCKTLIKQSLAGGSDSCNNAMTDYRKAQAEFISACGQAGVPQNTGSNDIACGFKMASCGCLHTKASSIGDVSCNGATDDDDDLGSFSSKHSDVPSASQTQRQIKYCPALAAQDTSKYEKDLDKLQDQVRSDEDKVNDAQDKAQKAQEDAQQKIDDINDKKTEAQSKYGEDQEKAQKDLSQAVKEVTQQLAQLQGQYQSLEEQISAQGLASSQAVIDANKSKVQVDLNCHAQATAMISKLQADALAINQAGRLNVGTQRQLLQLTGMSDYQRWEKIATKYYNRCINSKETVASKKMVTDSLAQSQRAITLQINNTRQREALLVQQMKDLRDPTKACAPVSAANPLTGVGSCPTTSSQECQQMCQAGLTQSRLYSSFAMKNADLDRQVASATQRGSQAASTAAAQVQKAQRRVSDDNTRLNNIRDFLGITRDAGSTGDNKAYANVMDKTSVFSSAASNFVSCGIKNGTCDDDPDCQRAKKYLHSVGQNLDYAAPVKPVTPAPAPASTGNPAGGAGGAAPEKQGQ